MKSKLISAVAAGIVCLAAGCQNTQAEQGNKQMKRAYTPPFKNANVSYTANKITKAIAKAAEVTGEFDIETAKKLTIRAINIIQQL